MRKGKAIIGAQLPPPESGRISTAADCNNRYPKSVHLSFNHNQHHKKRDTAKKNGRNCIPGLAVLALYRPWRSRMVASFLPSVCSLLPCSLSLMLPSLSPCAIPKIRKLGFIVTSNGKGQFRKLHNILGGFC